MISNIEAKILIVDDNENIHRDYKEVLQNEQSSDDDLISIVIGESLNNEYGQFPFKQLTLDFASCSDEAIEKVNQSYHNNSPYHIIFTDIKMPPGDDGIITIKKIWEKYPEQQIIIVTAYSEYHFADINKTLGVRKPNLFMIKKAFDSDSLKLMTQSLIIQEEINRFCQMNTENK